MEISLRPVDRSNWRAIVGLQLSEEQRHFVASNAFSLAQAAYEPDFHPFGIYMGDSLVGFIMYNLDDDFKPPMWGMCRLMVDQRYQKRGIGRRAIELLLALVRERHGHIQFYTSANPQNSVAIALYEKSGFKNTGEIVEDELLLICSL